MLQRGLEAGVDVGAVTTAERGPQDGVRARSRAGAAVLGHVGVGGGHRALCGHDTNPQSPSTATPRPGQLCELAVSYTHLTLPTRSTV